MADVSSDGLYQAARGKRVFLYNIFPSSPSTGWACNPTAGAVSPSPLSLFVVPKQNERGLGVTSRLKKEKVGSAGAEAFISVASLQRLLCCWSHAGASSSAAPWVLVLPKRVKVISAPSQAALLGDHLGIAFLLVFPTASLDLLLRMVLDGDLCRN